jgi:hypothetical protein
MATTTPNYGWTVPTSTDLVKDGATAIETLGDAIDASMNTALGTKKAGMVLLNTTSFSAVSSQSVSDVFSATYDHYKILVYATGTASANINLRYRVSGADNSTTNYSYEYLDADNATVAAGRVTGQTLVGLSTLRNGEPCTVEATILNPFGTFKTIIQDFGFDPSGLAILKANFGLFNATTSFTGFTLIAGSGTMTGNVSVYGYNK